MEDKAILQAMRKIMQEELTPINQKIDKLGTKVDTLETKMNTLENKVDEMAEELHIVHGAQNVIAEWVESLQTDVKNLNDLHSA